MFGVYLVESNLKLVYFYLYLYIIVPINYKFD